MTDHYKSIDQTLIDIRAIHQRELQACRDRTLAATLECEIMRGELVKAREELAFAERITTKLLTQFGLVATVFAEAKELALKCAAEREPTVEHTPVPKVDYDHPPEESVNAD